MSDSEEEKGATGGVDSKHPGGAVGGFPSGLSGYGGAPVMFPAPIPLSGISPPPHLDLQGNKKDSWKLWKQIWENYAIVAGLQFHPEEYKIALFLSTIGSD